MSFKTRLFLILWLAGVVGALSFLLVDLSALLKQFPVPAGTEVPEVTPALKLLSVVQPIVLLSVAVLIGVRLAPKVGLSAPVAEAAATKGSLNRALKPQIIPALLGGLAGGIAIILDWLLFKPFLPADFVVRSEELNKLLPVLFRLLYGGIAEELLLRWGFMTLLLWAAWRVFQRGQSKPRAIYVIGAIVISAIMFGVGHLPIAFLMAPNPGAALVFYVISANSVFGVIAGYLYWKKGLESAMIAHMMAHVVMLTAFWSMSNWLFH